MQAQVTVHTSPGPARVARDRCCGVCKERGGPAIGTSCSMCPQMPGHCLRELQRRERATAVISDPTGGHHDCCHRHQGSCVQARATAHNFLGACAACHCRRPCNLGPTSTGECMVHLTLWQYPAGLCCRRHSPHILTVTAVSIPLSGLSEQVGLNQPLLSPPSCLSGEQMPEGSPHAEAEPKPKLNPRICETKEEKGKYPRAAAGAAD